MKRSNNGIDMYLFEKVAFHMGEYMQFAVFARFGGSHARLNQW